MTTQEITGINTALMTFWSQFNIPVFLTGHVPERQTYPYITIDIKNGAFAETGILTAFDWHKIAPSSGFAAANQERANIMDLIAAAIPNQGVRIPITGGFIKLERNGSSFQEYYDDPEDQNVIGGRNAYQVRYFVY